MMNIKIIVALHKPYIVPDNPIYVPVQAGASLREPIDGCIPDHQGENISFLNPYYCELTALYYAWKNMDYDYLGLVHYRRYFTLHRFKKGFEWILNEEELADLIKEHDIILPIPRNYVIETNYTQYIHAHHRQDLDATRSIIETCYPSYLDAFDKVMAQSIGHRCNMFIMSKEKADDYMNWLFPLLFRLEQALSFDDYSEADKRVFGLVAERLLDVWITKNQYTYKDIPVMFLEKQNWPLKCLRFIARKMKGGKR